MFDNYKVQPFHIMFPKASACENVMMTFLIEDNDLLEKYHTIWDNVNVDTKNNLIATSIQ